MDELQEVTKKLSFLPLIYKKMIVRQLVFGVSGAIALGILFDIHAGISLLAGVMPVVIGVLVASPIANKKNNDNPGGIVINALKAEAVKIFLILALMWLEFKFYNDLVPMALVVGLVMAALISGIAISHIDNIKIENKE
ncbi:MAG: ATP synthase subunit I [Betaproteobacteria bacterium]|nr:ATP synthase subunit I [Betaproteobacteria bacterium]MCH9841735.1 ATP synthase subunit I [Betaproteobacteria bacterium]